MVNSIITLKKFINNFLEEQEKLKGKIGGGTFGSRAWVSAPGFLSLYVRIGSRYINYETRRPVLDIASLEAKNPGNGAFSKLVSDLRADYHTLWLYVENPGARFQMGLRRRGFLVNPDSSYTPNFYLEPINNNMNKP